MRNRLGEEICDALGLKHVKRLEIMFAVNETPTVLAQINVVDDEGKIADILKKYKLVEIGQVAE